MLRKPPDGLGYYSPIPVQPRIRPPLLPPAQVARDAGPWATVFMSDVYNGLEPAVRRGEVKQVAVVEEIAKEEFAPLIHDGVPGARGYAANTAFGFQFPLVSCGATYAPKKIWGYADVAADGSAHFQVPAGLPIYFLALDAEGRAVQRMRTFTHFQPGEVQSCVGCHADRNYATPSVARRERRRGTQELRPPDWGVKAFSYREVVQPVLDRHCVECHHARDPPGGVDLAGDLTDFFNVSYERAGPQGHVGRAAPGRARHRGRQEGKQPLHELDRHDQRHRAQHPEDRTPADLGLTGQQARGPGDQRTPRCERQGPGERARGRPPPDHGLDRPQRAVLPDLVLGQPGGHGLPPGVSGGAGRQTRTQVAAARCVACHARACRGTSTPASKSRS
jgi:hypothetical protein